MNDIIVIENSLTIEQVNEFENHLTNPKFPWYVSSDINPDHVKNKNSNPSIIVDRNSINTLQLGHTCVNADRKNNSEFFPVAKNICDIILSKINFNNPSYHRIKFNLLTNNSKASKINHNIPHVDSTKSDWVLLYYVNDSDGDTLLFKQRYDGKVKDCVSVWHRISPQKGKALIFKSDIFHTSCNPIYNDKRIVMNVNFSIN